MLELALASFVGAMVVITGISVINSILSTNTTLDRRFTEVNEVERTRRILQRSLTMLVMSEQQRPADAKNLLSSRSSSLTAGRTARSTTSESAAGTGAGSAATSEAGVETQASSRTLPPPRLELKLLDDSGIASAVAAMRSEGSNQAAAQTLELVCSRPPVPSGRPIWLMQQTSDAGTEASADETESNTSSMPRATRGRFELLPASDALGAYWELWWHPLPPLDNSGNVLPGYTDPERIEQLLGTPTRLCSKITEFQWSAFDDGVNKTSMDAIWMDELPAYMRVQLKTRAGLAADWLFEIDYTTGAETLGNTVAGAGGNGENNQGGGGREQGGGQGQGGQGAQGGGSQGQGNGTKLPSGKEFRSKTVPRRGQRPPPPPGGGQ